MDTKERLALREELNKQGYAVKIDMWPAKATYYKPDGEAMPNLPADPWSMRRYLRRGFTLVPPMAGASNGLTCPLCGFVAKARIGLVSHMNKKHGK